MQEMYFSPHQGYEIYRANPFGEGLKRWLEVAPGFHLDRVQTPLRIEALRAVSVIGEWEIYSSLRHQSKPVDLIYFPEAQHKLQRPLERMASQQRRLDTAYNNLQDRGGCQGPPKSLQTMQDTLCCGLEQ